MSVHNWAYLVRCADNSLYAGWTNDLPKRLAAHNSGTGAKYTRGRGPVGLAWAKSFATKNEAMAEEFRLKRLAKGEKESLVRGFDAAGLLAGLEEGQSVAGQDSKAETASRKDRTGKDWIG